MCLARSIPHSLSWSQSPHPHPSAAWPPVSKQKKLELMAREAAMDSFSGLSFQSSLCFLVEDWCVCCGCVELRAETGGDLSSFGNNTAAAVKTRHSLHHRQWAGWFRRLIKYSQGV